MLWADGQWFWVRGYWKEDSRAAVEWLRARLGPGAVVAVAPSYYDQPLAYYSNKAGAALQFVDIPPGTDSLALRPLNALVLTRLHHVPDWKKLKASFVRRAGPGVLETEVAGYQVLISQSHR
jgi:hypothetical protein